MAGFKEPSSKEAGNWKYEMGATITAGGKSGKVKVRAFIGSEEHPCYFVEELGRWVREEEVE